MPQKMRENIDKPKYKKLYSRRMQINNLALKSDHRSAEVCTLSIQSRGWTGLRCEGKRRWTSVTRLVPKPGWFLHKSCGFSG
jgi:hypothetical protein